MAQRNHPRVDRFAQMSKQEEIIAKKRQEILEKQRTAQLAKAVAAAQNLQAQLKTTEAPPLKTPPVADEEEVEEEPPLPVDITLSSSAAAPIEEGNGLEAGSSETAAGKGKADDATTTKSTLNSFTSKTGKISFGLKRQQLPQPSVEQPPPKVQNTFCNDGSFLENFKKILEKHEKPPAPIMITNPALSNDDNNSGGEDNTPQMDSMPIAISSSAGSIATSMPCSITVTSSASSHLAFSMAVSAPPPPPFNPFNQPLMQQGPPQMQTMQMPTFFHGHLPMQLHPSAVAPPPPPPPPQMPIALANMGQIYMQLGPGPVESMQLNAIPPPKDFDLNAIPKPQVNLEAIQIPTIGGQAPEQLGLLPEHIVAAAAVNSHPPPPPPPLELDLELEQHQLQHGGPVAPPPQPPQQLQQHPHPVVVEPPPRPLPQVFSETCIQLPTCLENLIALVADNGEDYEDKIRLHRSELHPALWFLYDKNCEQYRSYRSQLLDYERQRIERQREREQQKQLSREHNQQKEEQQQLPPHQEEHNSNSAADKYDPESAISADFDSDDEYMRGMMDRNRDNIKRRIECRNELSDEERREREEAAAAGIDGDELDDAEDKESQRQRRKRERKSRWGEKEQLLPCSSSSGTFANQNKPMLSTITRTDPALLQYARLNYGSTQLTDEQWKQCEEHYKVNLLYQDMMRKRQEIDRLARGGKFKYEYDSDEDIEGGTWEHKLRNAEMEATSLWANALTKQSEGKHHIGDFLPPEELKKFMEQYEAKKNNRQPDLSDYKEYKLKEDNIGFQMLQKLGWKEGQGLGQDGAGIVDPVNKAPQRDGNQGLGVSSAAAPEDCDNEYDAYRKRMMLAYRFRPNPLNNPRRAYY
ncbi:SURP and G-patch domain-containing protein 1 isoform X1 [Drosophila guanche]|uniref:Blast:SURP and G-patch domain-containing protein 1 n=1 Tax=Drosophila guanche TaxID=7266 RepID=A0A3B0JVD8_DROGU|nr:SURP and G-patch domain-containing protein 1 isoform X1 [Drosophila guanche]SPP84372.1 blast:SURP and G-patch domain-containing protein 1 [Drosophila guanche]